MRALLGAAAAFLNVARLALQQAAQLAPGTLAGELWNLADLVGTVHARTEQLAHPRKRAARVLP